MKCEIIRDLLPVYCDGLASEETRAEVDRHVAECDDCRERLRLIREAVPDVPEPDIQPMKKIKRSLRLRLALVIGMVCLGLLAGLYNMLVANPMAISSDKIEVTHYSRGKGEKVYICTMNIRGNEKEVSIGLPTECDVDIDKANNCVWVDGRKLEGAEINGETIYAPANGTVYDSGVLTLFVRCDTPFKYMRVERTPIYNHLVAVEQELTLRPCLPFRQDIDMLYDDKVSIQEYEAISLGKGASLTIHCRDKDVVVDLHELALEEGLLKE
ncbi:MAG: zf-HC2 domain-containing protein [Ruminococcus sp.]|nr:zf-HC2 domain-containing protein [Ruminococcus sp.]